jgi:hypothetical protein
MAIAESRRADNNPGSGDQAIAAYNRRETVIDGTSLTASDCERLAERMHQSDIGLGTIASMVVNLFRPLPKK